jgi:hypothetical protein
LRAGQATAGPARAAAKEKANKIRVGAKSFFGSTTQIVPPLTQCDLQQHGDPWRLSEEIAGSHRQGIFNAADE